MKKSFQPRYKIQIM